MSNQINTVTLLKDVTIYLLDNNSSLVYSTDSNITELPSFINPESLADTMTSSLHMTNDICDSITELNTLTQNIEDIMTLVDNISGQTNLLALNASIEAARVGEDGKGFSVVANEVRNLADQSKASTKEVVLH